MLTGLQPICGACALLGWYHQDCPHDAGAADIMLPVQSSASQPKLDVRRDSDMTTLRRRQSFNYADRSGPSVLSDVDRALLGPPPGEVSMHQAAPAAAAPAVKLAVVKLLPRAKAVQPSARAAPRGPQAAQKASAETGPAQRKSVAQQARSATPKPVPSPPKQSQLDQAAVVEPRRAQRQGSSMAQLVDKYKSEAAARKLAHHEATIERVNSLATTLQRAPSHVLPAATMPSTPLRKQPAAAKPAGAMPSTPLHKQPAAAKPAGAMPSTPLHQQPAAAKPAATMPSPPLHKQPAAAKPAGAMPSTPLHKQSAFAKPADVGSKASPAKAEAGGKAVRRVAQAARAPDRPA